MSRRSERRERGAVGVLALAALVSQVCLPVAAAAQATGAAAVPATDSLPEIVVTGSRLPRKELASPAPVTVITREQVAASGRTSLGDFLQTLPEQGNAINTSFNNGGDGSTRVNLRSLGVHRTLVLLNGRRMVPGGLGADSSVDLNAIPIAIVERIEVLKDGASAIYGSDAIGGVVNVITRSTLDGVEASSYVGSTTHGDGTVYDLGAVAGASSDRASVLFSAGFMKQEPILARDRAFSAAPTAFDATGATSPSGRPGRYTYGGPWAPGGAFSVGAPGQAVPNPGNDPRVALYNELVTRYPEATKFIRDPSAPLGWRPYVAGSLPTSDPPGDAYNYNRPNDLVTPQQRISLFSSGEVKLGAHARTYFEALFVNRQSSQQVESEPITATVSGANPYNPFGVDVTVDRHLVEFGLRRFSQDVDTFRLVTGLDGALPEEAGPLHGWSWDLSLNFGRTQSTQQNTGSLRASLLAEALGPGAGGQCLDGAGQPIAGCAPLDLDGVGSVTPDQVARLGFTGSLRGTNQMLALQANTSGELFRLWGEEPAALALGYEYRDLRGSLVPDAITAAGDTTGNVVTPTAGAYHVHEAYVELSVPLLAGLPLAESVDATAAARAFRYSNFGGDFTYKLGGRWSLVRDLAFRGTYSTAFRAPSIADLYLGQQDSYPAVSDPCADAATAPASCPGAARGNGDTSPVLRSKIGGNPRLRPETARIFTLGAVLQPRWVKNLSLTADYYNLHIDDTISAIGEATLLNGCYPSSGAPNEAYCSAITRDATGRITEIRNLNANVGKEFEQGVDFALRYARPTAFGRFAFASDVALLLAHDVTLPDGTVIHGRGNFDLNGTDGNYGGFGGVNPTWKFAAALTWGLGGWGAGAQTRYVGSFTECGDSAGDFSGLGQCYADGTYRRTVSAYSTWDLFASYTVRSAAGSTSFAVGVNNLFDATPPAIYNAFTAATDPTAYDLAGRFVYGRITHRL